MLVHLQDIGQSLDFVVGPVVSIRIHLNHAVDVRRSTDTQTSFPGTVHITILRFVSPKNIGLSVYHIIYIYIYIDYRLYRYVCAYIYIYIYIYIHVHAYIDKHLCEYVYIHNICVFVHETHFQG